MIFITVLVVNHQHLNTEFTLTMVDVGQGDAFVIQDHKNYKTVLIDTGGAYKHDDSTINLSDKTLLPYLKEQGIDFIDLLIISHLDLDHSGEVINILEKKEVGNIL
ncbi:ComEC/Rec2 family competence protein [Jeotgalicoccus sp. WY2]|uniref:ComEC/Rec2 family competence protein n=1 Tax=Jeotgalicoccus sp. WY2 TaxID=2708346 RepID=UPI001BD6D01E|nr:MBL fold metallo-hydrolase [Jeotgalicoccus sp. WY2]